MAAAFFFIICMRRSADTKEFEGAEVGTELEPPLVSPRLAREEDARLELLPLLPDLLPSRVLLLLSDPATRRLALT